MDKPVFPLAENSARRPFAGAQMGFAAVALFPIFSLPGTFLAAALFAVPFLLGFLLDWFSVSGFSVSQYVIKGSFPGRISEQLYPTGIRDIKRVASKWMPFLMRSALVTMLIVWLQGNFLRSVQSLARSTVNRHLPDLLPSYWIGLLLLLLIGGLVLIAAGIAGRAAALFVLFGLGMYLEIFQLGFFEVLLVFAAMGLFYLGTGPYSLWLPEGKLITRRLGES